MYPTDLITLLRDYTPADPREQEFLRRMRDLLGAGSGDAASPGACARTRYAPGHFTVSAFVVSEDHARIALIFHPKFRRWLQPGGHIEATDTTLDAAARREIAEESGITDLRRQGGLFDLDVHDIPAGKEPAHLHFDLRLLYVAGGAAGGPGSDPALAGEHAGQWVPLDGLDQVDTDPSVRRGTAKIRRG